jgi:cell wall-associated NlpC family hydrolase
MDGGSYKFNPQASLDPTQLTDSPFSRGMDDGLTPMGVPDAHTMLGAWGISNPVPEQLNPIDIESGMGTFISQGTNSVIQQMAEEGDNFGFAKGVDGWRKAVIQAARTAVGTPYVWGGTNLQSGVDCSGLIQAAFAKAGLNLPRVSYQQANFGTRSGMKGLRPGDLWAWDNSSRNSGADHIALYLGNGMILEAARPGTSVRIRRLDPSEGGWGVRLNF